MKNNISQKESFLNGEGDSWFNRNSLLSEIDYKYVFNKIDLVDADKISYLKQSFPDSLMVSATRSLQVSDIKDAISEKYDKWINALKNP